MVMEARHRNAYHEKSKQKKVVPNAQETDPILETTVTCKVAAAMLAQLK